MTMSFIWIMVAYSFGMACGQVLFKLAAMSAREINVLSSPLAYLNIYFIGGLILYVGLTVLWVWVLRFVPLSKAYPFVALAFIFTPLLARFMFDEKLSFAYFVGLALIAGGVIIIARQ